MNSIYNLINAKNITTSVVLPKEYPPDIGEEFYYMMQDEGLSDPENNHMFVFFRKSRFSYIDIYVVDMQLSEVYRFVIINDKKLLPEEEDLFIAYLKSNYTKLHLSPKFCEETHDFSQYSKYNNGLEKAYIESLYFTTHKNAGIKELLYKAGMDNISYNIQRFDEINLIGTNVEEIFELQISVLRKFNDKKLIPLIFSKYDRQLMGNVYRQYHNTINSGSTSYYQWLYLKELFLNKDTDVWGESFNKQIFKKMHYVNNIETFDDYKEFLLKRERCYGYIGLIELPKPNEIYEWMKKLNFVLAVTEDRELNHMLDNYYHEFSFFEYEEPGYKVEMPKNIKEYFHYTCKMGNCLLEDESYIADMAAGDKVLLFISDRFSGEKIVAEVIIRYDEDEIKYEINQVFKSFNRILDVKEAKRFYAYCKEMNIDVSVENLTGDFEFVELDESDQEERISKIKQWISDLEIEQKLKNKMKKMEQSVHQLTIEELLQGLD